MKLTVLGGAGGWPPAGTACSGYLIEHAGFRLLVDPGYATFPRLLEYLTADAVDAVIVSHGHPDHVADLNPLLRSRAMRDHPAPRLPIYALPGALTPVLALDQPGVLDEAYELRDFRGGDAFRMGPFHVESSLLPHFVPNAALRLTASGRSITYTGDAGSSDDLVTLAAGTDLLLTEATYIDHVPVASSGRLNSASEVGRQAQRAGAARLLLCHLWPATDADAALRAARRAYAGSIAVATGGVVIDL